MQVRAKPHVSCVVADPPNTKQCEVGLERSSTPPLVLPNVVMALLGRAREEHEQKVAKVFVFFGGGLER